MSYLRFWLLKNVLSAFIPDELFCWLSFFFPHFKNAFLNPLGLHSLSWEVSLWLYCCSLYIMCHFPLAICKISMAFSSLPMMCAWEGGLCLKSCPGFTELQGSLSIAVFKSYSSSSLCSLSVNFPLSFKSGSLCLIITSCRGIYTSVSYHYTASSLSLTNGRHLPHTFTERNPCDLGLYLQVKHLYFLIYYCVV